MAELQDDGTVSSRLAPIVTVLTEALVHDLGEAYAFSGREVTPEHVYEDTEKWLMDLRGDYGGHEAATRVISMIRRNPGWIRLLGNRVLKSMGYEE